jgi:SAM-dependent methyltransferase
MTETSRHPASFRDPAGFVFQTGGVWYRQVNQVYAENYDYFKSSGLYEHLLKQGMIIPHEEIKQNITGSPEWYKTILPKQIPFISYPYEWCFEQLKDAALLTLTILKESIKYGMILKDATPFNIQFISGRPLLIDSLSFEKYDSSQPWVAYRQFVECFMAPLLISKYHAQDLIKCLQAYPDGIPLHLLGSLLPWKSRFRMNNFLHVFLPNRIARNRNQSSQVSAKFTEQKLKNIVDNLISYTDSLHPKRGQVIWEDYYEDSILSQEYFTNKKKIVSDWLREIPSDSILDLGSNTGVFAEMAAAMNKFTLAIDSDAGCINQLYQRIKKNRQKNLLPLVVDIANPSAGIGWSNQEREPFLQRVHVDLVMALALIHHLCIAKNIGMNQLARLLSKICQYLIIEFIPKEDLKVQEMLRNRIDVFPHYREEEFFRVFSEYFDIIHEQNIAGSGRTLYLMNHKDAKINT